MGHECGDAGSVAHAVASARQAEGAGTAEVASARAAPTVRAWAQRQSTHELSISVITVMEIEIGIARLERRDTAQSEVLG
ncbi:type II toxin-antitoxin system VapC family toxin [Blastococcus sp. CCUG 61487]|uniref:type II toxin-antitoxin system VapC family toxin n=1 Tax=Blastococcus sp. CCUG 61487 TaxID=1840703 RepID=UPI0010C04D23|nr:type II toxin-antitoxin system VapC family toxin [Blastococcus sp. CCUG 61487]TKJ21973.1 hypothetical protein A6V29_06670 [Blastococcus sp. CCUG 61487]